MRVSSLFDPRRWTPSTGCLTFFNEWAPLSVLCLFARSPQLDVYLLYQGYSHQLEMYRCRIPTCLQYDPSFFLARRPAWLFALSLIPALMGFLWLRI